MSHWLDYKELRRRLRFEMILSRYNIKAKIKGDRATAICPLPGHPPSKDGKPPSASLSIHLGRSIYQCFSCKSSGNALEFACRIEGFDPADPKQFREAAARIAEIFSLQTEPPPSVTPIGRPPVVAKSPTPDASSPTVRINAPLNFSLKDLDVAHPYLRDRGLTQETIAHFGLGYCNRGLMKGRVAIPLHNPQGELVGYAGRITQDQLVSDACPKYRFPGERVHGGVRHAFRKSLLLYNVHRATGPDLLVVEGFPSVWWLHQCGYPNTVALMGSSCSGEQTDLNATLAKRVWIMSDGDDAGQRCAEELWQLLGHRAFCRRIPLPSDRQPTDLSIQTLKSLFQ